jgi:cytochrome c biogenesis protein CcmG/thiol:disulfide interchange protein DsbE
MFKSLKLYRFAIPLVVFVLLAGLLWQGLGHTSAILPSVLVGKPVPPFKLTAINDTRQLYTQEIFPKGQLSLLNVWATWCVACRYEHGFLLRLAQQGVPIYGLNYRDRRESAQTWLRDFGNPYRLTLFDGDGRTAIDLGVYGTPETYLIDQNGIIRYRHVGVLDKYVWEREFLPRMGG